MPIWMCSITLGLIDMLIDMVLEILPRFPLDKGFGESGVDSTVSA